ncbi:MAG: hypothetical protein QGI09_07850, partial [Dehalococcoidia bacterium]|nr:hypothetical protein [Dehalococcoidia bacterium]
IHSDWASTGINRSVIDKRVKANSLVSLLASIALPKKVQTEFLYPRTGGFGAFFDRLLDLCTESENFDLLLGNTLSSLEDHGSKFDASTKDGRSLSFDSLVWAGNINDLCRLISPIEYDLHYLNTIFYYVICENEGVGKVRAQWIYISKGDGLVSRITCMKEFSPRNCPEGYYNFICEVTDSQLKPIYFRDPSAYQDGVIGELEGMSFLKHARHIEAIHINPVVDTYPIYHKRYLTDFGQVTKTIKQFAKRIHLLGRSGAFWYNNSDHSIRMALDMSRKLLVDPEEEFDYRGYFGGNSQEDKEHE